MAGQPAWRVGEPDWRGAHFAYVIAYLGDDGWRGPCKVGITRDPKRRLSSLQSGNPYPLSIYGVVRVERRECVAGLEAFVHERLKDRRLAGEWFAVEPATALIFASFHVACSAQETGLVDAADALTMAREHTWLMPSAAGAAL
jgi:hypothetical protein